MTSGGYGEDIRSKSRDHTAWSAPSLDARRAIALIGKVVNCRELLPGYAVEGS